MKNGKGAAIAIWKFADHIDGQRFGAWPLRGAPTFEQPRPRLCCLLTEHRHYGPMAVAVHCFDDQNFEAVRRMKKIERRQRANFAATFGHSEVGANLICRRH